MALVPIDLSAAFNTVDHTILLNILNAKYSITGQALKWFDSYLKQRTFKVVIDNNYSKPHSLDVCVPQGSCAGVSIFTLNCSTLHEVIPSSLILSGFADDHSVRKCFKAGSNTQELNTKHTWKCACLTLSSGWML